MSLKDDFPNASKSFLKLNPHLFETHHDSRSSRHPEPEPPVRHEPVATTAGEASHPNRLSVRIVCFRQRLCDTDNCAPKYFIDCLRYAEIIPDDTPESIELVVRQEKVRLKSDERTELTVEPIL
jgi:hypothetical protein